MHMVTSVQMSPMFQLKKQRTAESAPTVDDEQLLDDSDPGLHVPKTPKLDDTFKKHVDAAKSTDLSLYEHVDEQVKIDLGEKEMDALQDSTQTNGMILKSVTMLLQCRN
eukprot:s758_g20.t1